MTDTAIPAIIVMGVSGSGKTTVGEGIAEKLGIPFIDGDSLHPAANVEKMRAGIPLTDEDRMPWLHRIGEELEKGRREGHATVIACSALKRSYRDLLKKYDCGPVFVYLHGSREVIAERMSHRKGHYMPTSLLDSQLATLEEPTADERVIPENLETPPRLIIDDAIDRIRKGA